MPELPEVETIKRQLSRKIGNKTIKKVDVRFAKFVKAPIEKFKKAVEGAKIKSIERRAKLLIINLSSGYSLVIHLKMTGQLIYKGKSDKKHTHLIYYFTDNSHLIHNDYRRFGFVKLIPTKELEEYFTKEKYGPEPLEKKFTLKLFKDLLDKKGRAKIKPLLMDQTFIAGIGNLYADEILFYAKVQPTRKISTLKPEEIKRIYQGIKKILLAAISKQGSSADTYVDTAGKKGKYFPSSIKVYRRDGQSCYKCGTKIKHIKLGGRSAHFCPKCQQ